MLIPDPDFIHPGSQVPDQGSWIPDSTTTTKEEREKNLLSHLFFVATNFTKLKTILFLNR
jgi:hypothetical protein